MDNIESVNGRKRWTKYAPLLRQYFYSGWAFFIPYLAAYLLYAWLKWPVNPANSGEGTVEGICEKGSTVFFISFISPPCLLYVYWILHAAHLLLGSYVIASWWHTHHQDTLGSNLKESPVLHWISPALPWLCLAIVLIIPGVYLEMPADPWAHFSRVNDWRHFSNLLANPEWLKSGSFLLYSIVEPLASPVAKLRVFGLCSTTFGLLYYWQYYGLAQSCGIPRRLAWCAVLANLLLFGNNIFGFQRYYGMATTILAQIGVVAMARYAIGNTRPETDKNHAPNGILLARWAYLLALFAVLLSLIAFNHVQGLALAVMALAGIWGCRLVSGHPKRFLWLGSVYLLVNLLAILFRAEHPDSARLYQASNWLNAWYGFNLFDIHSRPFDRALQIFGLLGLFNLSAGILLIARRPLVAWLTILPVIVLLSPACGILFVNTVTRIGPVGYEYVYSFNRLLLGIPSGLALCCVLDGLCDYLKSRRYSPSAVKNSLASAMLAVLLLLFTTLPPSTYYYNRLWHVLMKAPDDLQMLHVAATTDLDLLRNQRAYGSSRVSATPAYYVMATPGVGFVLASFSQTDVMFRNKWMLYPSLSTPADRINNLLLGLKPLIQQHQAGIVFLPTPTSIYSPYSQAGYLSGHWLTNQIALEQAGSAEIVREIAPYHKLRFESYNAQVYGSN